MIAMGYVDLSHELALEILKGLSDVESPRNFTVIKDAIPADAKVVSIVPSPTDDTAVRITFMGEGVESRFYTPTLQVEFCEKLETETGE